MSEYRNIILFLPVVSGYLMENICPVNIEFENSIDNSEVLIASIKYAIPSSATIQSLDLELDTGAGY